MPDIPLAPVVVGPIMPTSVFVVVQGVLAGAEVTVTSTIDGVVSTAIASANGSVEAPFVVLPTVGARLSAIQSVNGLTSQPTLNPVSVSAIPNPLPVPVAVSPVTDAMSAILVQGLVPGADVEISLGGATVGGGRTYTETAWLDLDANAATPVGSRLSITQHIAGVASKAALTLPLARALGPEEQLPAPTLGHIAACDTQVRISNAIPTAEVVVLNAGQSPKWTNQAPVYVGGGAQPFEQGPVEAVQSLRRLGKKSPAFRAEVGPEVPPPAPTVLMPYCSDAKLVALEGLHPGGQVLFLRRVITGPGSFSQVVLGVAGIAASTQTFSLPQGTTTSDPGGPVEIRVYQKGCTMFSPEVVVPLVQASPPAGAPRLATPVYACSHAVLVELAHPGSSLQLVSGKTNQPLSDVVAVTTVTMKIRSWLPLGEGDEVHVVQHGCSSDAVSNVVPVTPHPSPVPSPAIALPLRPQSPSVRLTGVVPGARVHLLIDGRIRSAIEALQDIVDLPVPGAPLQVGQHVFAVQSICGDLSPLEGQGVSINAGIMDLTVSPTSLVRGTGGSVLVKAVDHDLKTDVVGATIRLGGKTVGTTGTAFSYVPALGESDAAGTATRAPAYSDAAFTLAFTDPPPKAALLHLNVGNEVLVKDVLAITKASWTLTPQWGDAQQTVVGTHPVATFGPPKAGANAAQTRIQVELTCEFTVNGYINGILFQGTEPAFVSPQPCFLHGKGADWTAAWIAKYDVFPH